MAYTGDLHVPETLTEPTGDSGEDDSVGPRNIPGYDRVTALDDFLVNLRDCNGALSNQEPSQLVARWKNLSMTANLLPLVHDTSHNSDRGGLKLLRNPSSFLVQVAKRCSLGQNSGLASRPG